MTAAADSAEADQVEDLRRELFATTLLGVSPAEERWVASELVRLKAVCRQNGVPGWFAWACIQRIAGPWIEACLAGGTDYDRMLWGAVKSRILAYLES